MIFPHHENEIAQAEGATGKQFVKYWLHNGFIKMGETKMSKSLGNIKLVREILDEGYTGQDIRFFMLQASYRGPITFTYEILDEAKTGRKRVLNGYKTLLEALDSATDDTENPKIEKEIDKIRAEFIAAMDDDFNTPLALGKLFDLVNQTNRLIIQDDVKSKNILEKLKSNFDDLGYKIFGLHLEEEKANELNEEEQALLDARAKAREEKNWAESDRIRNELKKRGVIVRDSKDGQKWTRIF